MSPRKGSAAYTASLTLGAVGVVFGDIGTSPLYAVQQCFLFLHKSSPDAGAVLGILSLIFWSLILVVCVKYLTFIIRCDHDGEGGTLALLGLLQINSRSKEVSSGNLALLVLFGLALLYGDGVITPSISVLSAVEGLRVATPSAQPFVVPIALGILIALFLFQYRGTGRIGALFGPVMVIWFVSISVLGIGGIWQAPHILSALDPREAIDFLQSNGWIGFSVLGAVVLCFSGAEALFADLALFGRVPIRVAWYGLALPALLLNYFGQGAWILRHPAHDPTSFYGLVPAWALYPVVGLSTVATVIASQAVIAGVFSLTEQAIHMGYCPRFEIVQTSSKERGQVYIAVVNYALMIGCVAVVIGFRSSERLGGAYGLAVIGTMTVTSMIYYLVLRRVANWSTLPAASLAGLFLIIDLLFLAANLTKIASGAWVPLVIAGFVLAIFWTWTRVDARYQKALAKCGMPVEQFCKEVSKWRDRHENACVLVTRDSETVPLVKSSPWLRVHVRHEQILLVTVANKTIPYVSEEEMGHTEKLGPDFYRITGAFGFMQHPDVTRLLKSEQEQVSVKWDGLVCYLPKVTLVTRKGWWSRSLLSIYNALQRNSLSTASYLRVPPEQVVYVNLVLEI